MTLPLVNVGSVPGDDTGDKGQVPFTKVNAGLTAINTLNAGGVGTGAVLVGQSSSLIAYTSPATGAVATTVAGKLAQTVSVFDFMTAAQQADWQSGTYLFDHAPFIQDAVSTGAPVYLPAGNPLLKTAITVTTPGQRISGAGPRMTLLSVQSSFNISAQGVFILAESAQPGAELQDFGIYFVQPDTATYANLTQYPPGIYMVHQPRVNLRRLRIANAITCINMAGNSGGAFLEDLELSHYLLGINMGLGSGPNELDTVRLENCHFWPFGAIGAGDMTTNQQVIYNGASNVGIAAQNVNELSMVGVGFLCGTGMTIAESSIASMWALITNCAFDTNNGITLSGGQVFIENSYFSPGASANYAISQTGGQLKIDNNWFVGVPAVAIIVNTNDSENPVAITDVRGSIISGLPANSQFLTGAITAGDLWIRVSECEFPALPQNTSPTNAIIQLAGGTSMAAHITNNKVYYKGSGTGNFIAIAADGGANIITGNEFLGWGASLPAGSTTTLFSDNTGAPSVPGIAWNIDGSIDTLVIANGANAPFAAGAGMVLVEAQNLAQIAIYLLAGGGASLVSTPGTTWVSPTTTPASGKVSVQYDGSTNYRIYNNSGGSVTVGCVMLRTNPSN
jgi:hypothetical protein